MGKIQITIKDKLTQKIIAQGISGVDVLKGEGNLYFSPLKVNLQGLMIKEKAYYCPVKKGYCDYYFLNDKSGSSMNTELCWVYREVLNTEFKHIENKIGFYSFDRGNGAVIEETQI